MFLPQVASCRAWKEGTAFTATRSVRLRAVRPATSVVWPVPGCFAPVANESRLMLKWYVSLNWADICFLGGVGSSFFLTNSSVGVLSCDFFYCCVQDAEVAARIEEEQRKLAEARAILEEKELEELRARLAEEEAKQLAILEAEASGMPMVEEEEVPPAPEASSTSSSSSSSTDGGRRRRGSAAKVDYVALAAKMNAEKIMREKQAAKE
jgi:hypothetical protein